MSRIADDIMVAEASVSLSELVEPNQPDPYCTAMMRARLRAMEVFNKEYNQYPDWSRAELGVRNSSFRVTVIIIQDVLPAPDKKADYPFNPPSRGGRN